MKSIKHLLLLSGLLSLSMPVMAVPLLAPASLANESLFVTITNSTGLLASTGFSVIIVDSTGLGYTQIGTGANSSGLDVYLDLGASASLVLTDDLLGVVDTLFDFTAPVTGTFGLTNLLSTQSGLFSLATNQCPLAISGQTVTFNVLSGKSPLSTSGTFSVSNGLSDKTFVMTGIDGNTSGTFTYSNLNLSTALWQAIDTNSDNLSVYLGFSNQTSGSFAMKVSSGGYQTGTFTITNNYPAGFFDSEIPLGGGTYWLQFADATNFGYYNLSFYPFVYHFDMGWEYFFDANDGHGGCYLYDFTTDHFMFTSPSVFPFLYDFSRNSWLYYFPNSTNSQRYTSNPRYFYQFSTTNTITQ